VTRPREGAPPQKSGLFVIIRGVSHRSRKVFVASPAPRRCSAGAAGAAAPEGEILPFSVSNITNVIDSPAEISLLNPLEPSNAHFERIKARQPPQSSWVQLGPVGLASRGGPPGLWPPGSTSPCLSRPVANLVDAKVFRCATVSVALTKLAPPASRYQVASKCGGGPRRGSQRVRETVESEQTWHPCAPPCPCSSPALERPEHLGVPRPSRAPRTAASAASSELTSHGPPRPPPSHRSTLRSSYGTTVHSFPVSIPQIPPAPQRRTTCVERIHLRRRSVP